jgi:hypothetical protein
MCTTHQSCSGSGTSRICSTYQICQTCYDHSNDWDWRVYTNIGDTFNINRIDRRGKKQPPRWTKVEKGQPYSATRIFPNYVKAAPDNLFADKTIDQTYVSNIPTYPSIFDYHYTNRVFDYTQSINAKEWNSKLSDTLRTLGASKGVNVIMIFTKHDQAYRHALENAWVGGRINDVIILTGVSDGNVSWVDVVSYAKNKGNETFQVTMKNELLTTELNPDKFMTVVSNVTNRYFDLPQPNQFEYLKDSIQATTKTIVVTMSIVLILTLILMVFFYHNDQLH